MIIKKSRRSQHLQVYMSKISPRKILILWVTSSRETAKLLLHEIIYVYGIYPSFPKLEKKSEILLSFCSLSGNNVSSEGATALAGALQVNQSLQTLK